MPETRYNPGVRAIILERLILRQQRERQQRQLIADTDLHHEEICRKLAGLWESTQYENLLRCGEEKIYMTCKCCGAVEEYSYRCNLKFCPRCQWRIAKTREEKIKVWAAHVKQPKHLVLTQKNFPALTRSTLKNHLGALQKFRRTELFKPVRGGCVSVEITNEGRGWHLHSHWLLDVPFLDVREAAIIWGKLVGQEFGIVHIRDVREKSFVQEVCKYLAKGNELSQWPPEQLLEFVTAIRGRRFFFCFGSLFKQGDAIRQQLKFMKPTKQPCDCGSRDFRFETEQQAVLNEIRRARRR